MKNTVIIIPARLAAKRFPGKPLAKIKGLPMIVHTVNRAKKSMIGEVVVATPDNEIVEVVEKNGSRAILTQHDHLSGSDRVYEVYQKNFGNNVDLIFNVQADNPLCDPNSISKLEKHMRKNNCSSVGTLASSLNQEEINNENVVKVEVAECLKENSFLKAKDFFRIKKDSKNQKIYHHIGIYAYNKEILKEYVNLKRTTLEVERKLEQMRFIQNNIEILVAYCHSNALSVDTREDLNRLEKEMG